MAIRTYDILLDSYNSTMPEPIVGRQGDKNGAVTLHVTITDRGSAVDLTGQTVNLMAETAKGTAIVADNDGVTVTNATDGKFDYAIPNALWSEAGKITKAYFSLNGANGQQTTYDLIFIIKKAVDISQGKADDYVTIVDGTLRSLKEKINAINTDFNNGLSTKVNTADMRKPASDVAGIEEVNAKQDKIGYTPADDSKVVHSTITELNSTDMNTVKTAGFYLLRSGTNGMPNADAWTIYQVVPLSGFNGVQLAYGTNNTILGIRSWHNGKYFSSWTQLADDSKVAHLSGAEEISGQKTFDVAPIDKTTGNPYITKDGVPAVPSTLADTAKDANFTGKLQKSGIDVATKSDVTTAVSTATANMVDSSKPTNFTAGLKSGGIDVATAADLKSVEASAWRQLADKYITLSSGTLNSNNFLYKIDSDKKYLYVLGGIVVNGRAVTVTIDFSWLVKNIKIDTKHYLQYYGNAPLNLYNVYDVTEKNKLEFTTDNGSSVNISTFSISGSSYAIYDELV